MSYKLIFEEKPGYLHAVVTGQNTRENVKRYFRELLAECRARDCRQILVEHCFEGPRLGTVDVFELASEASDLASGFLRAVAFVDVNVDSELLHFAENVAINRGLPAATFTSVADAEKWLLGVMKGAGA